MDREIMEINMKPLKDVDSAGAALTLRNMLWVLPYLSVMGLSMGYLAGGLLGAFIGLSAAVAVSAAVGAITTAFSGLLGGGAVDVFYGTGRRTIGLRDRLAGELNIARHHKLGERFDDALIKIEDILAKDPQYPEALFLKAQILWDGFGDADAAKQCLLKVIRVEPDKKAVFHRWALNLYGDIQKSTYFRQDDIMENRSG
jgi:tetratricopeptide (TPR) repeat protein